MVTIHVFIYLTNIFLNTYYTYKIALRLHIIKRVPTLFKHMIYQGRYIIKKAITMKEMYRTLHGNTK